MHPISVAMRQHLKCHDANELKIKISPAGQAAIICSKTSNGYPATAIQTTAVIHNTIFNDE